MAALVRSPHRFRLLVLLLALLALLWVPYAPFRDPVPTLHDFNPQIWSEQTGPGGGCCYVP